MLKKSNYMSQQSHCWVYIQKDKNFKSKDTCIPAFTAAASAEATTEKQPKRPLRDERVKR